MAMMLTSSVLLLRGWMKGKLLRRCTFLIQRHLRGLAHIIKWVESFAGGGGALMLK